MMFTGRFVDCGLRIETETGIKSVDDESRGAVGISTSVISAPGYYTPARTQRWPPESDRFGSDLMPRRRLRRHWTMPSPPSSPRQRRSIFCWERATWRSRPWLGAALPGLRVERVRLMTSAVAVSSAHGAVAAQHSSSWPPAGTARSPSQRSTRCNAELFSLTYGAIVTQVLKDYEEVDATNEQLEKMGYNIGVRLIDEFLAKAGVGPCQSCSGDCGGHREGRLQDVSA